MDCQSKAEIGNNFSDHRQNYYYDIMDIANTPDQICKAVYSYKRLNYITIPRTCGLLEAFWPANQGCDHLHSYKAVSY